MRLLAALVLLGACRPDFTSVVRHDDFDSEDDESPPADAAVDGRALDASAPDAIILNSCPDPIVTDPNDPDMDHDGVPNASDNCPRVYNPDQYNEDGDLFGDACDKCPPYPDNDQPNMDGDCVSDACDPRPTIPGDTIFLFEGFSGGIPQDWIRSGQTWTASNGWGYRRHC